MLKNSDIHIDSCYLKIYDLTLIWEIFYQFIDHLAQEKVHF